MDELEAQLKRYADAAADRAVMSTSRRRRRSWRPILAVAAVAVLIGGSVAVLATRDSDERIDTSPADEAADRTALEALGWRSPWNEYVATRDWLVVAYLGDMDFLDRAPEYAAAPLRGGEAVHLDVAIDRGRFSPRHLVADDDDAIVVGTRCAAPADDPPTYEERFCSTGEPTAVRIDPASGDVQELAVDPQVRALRGLGVDASQRRKDGWWIFGWLDRGAGRPRDTVLISATPDRLELVTRWTGDGRACATDDAVYQLGSDTPTAPSLRRAAIADRSVEAVDLPERNPDVSANFVNLVCTPQGPLLTDVSSDPARRGPTVHEWHDGRWRARPDLVPPGATSATTHGNLSDRGGAVLAWSISEPGRAGGRSAITVIPADGSDASFLDAGSGDAWHGASGARLGFVDHDDRDDPGGTTTTLPPGPFPGFGHLTLWE